MRSVRDGEDWLLRLEEHEVLPDVLATWARDEGIRGAAVLAGIGLVRDTEVGYLREGRYETHRFVEPLELLALAGSIAWEGGNPSVHLHLTGSRADHSVVGGHLIRSTIALLGEISIRNYPGRTFRRPPIPGTSLSALSVGSGPGR